MCILVTSCTQDFVKRRNLKKPPSFISIPCFSHHPQWKKNRLRWYRWYRWFWKCWRIIKGWRSVYLHKHWRGKKRTTKKQRHSSSKTRKIGASRLSPWQKFKWHPICCFLPSTFWMCLWMSSMIINCSSIHCNKIFQNRRVVSSILSPATLRQCGFRGLDRSHGSHWGGSLDWTAGHGALLKCEDLKGWQGNVTCEFGKSILEQQLWRELDEAKIIKNHPVIFLSKALPRLPRLCSCRLRRKGSRWH